MNGPLSLGSAKLACFGRVTRVALAALGAIIALPDTALCASPGPRPMLEVRSKSNDFEGTLLRSGGHQTEWLARDGQLLTLDDRSILSSRKLATPFRGAAPADVRAALERELDGLLTVGGEGCFVVAAPHGQTRLWSQRFVELYRSFVHYFAVRGLAPHEPDFPLVAVVWPSEEEFLRRARSEGHRIGHGVLGYYSPTTNRVSLFDSASLHGGDWGQTASVIIHEATHQTAFNTGLHNRFALPPRWITEGLGMMFEAPGVWNSERFPQSAQRVNHERLASFRRWLAGGRKPRTWLELVASDAMFGRKPIEAYAESWAFSFYLAETSPSKYNALLKRTAAKPDFSSATAAERLADFHAIFGDRDAMMEADFLRYIAAIR